MGGCGPLANATRTLVLEPAQYSRRIDALIECKRHRELAETAWLECAQATTAEYSADYIRGFKEGFADYLFAGGTGNPPPLPPRHYWRAEYQTPEGQQAIADWFAGFRHGAAVARQSNYRQLVTVPPSVSLIKPASPPVIPTSPPVAPAPPSTGPKELPVPRPVPPDAEKQPNAGVPPPPAPPAPPSALPEQPPPMPAPPAPPGTDPEQLPAPQPVPPDEDQREADGPP
jgi:hypothetical protein